MKKLTPIQFQKAVEYLHTFGRPLDRELYAYEFEAASPQASLEALAAFQNADGGYGWALEPDIRAEASSVIATSQAMTLLRRLGAPAQEPQVDAAIAYLVRQFDHDRLVWPIVPPEIEAAPHAPWWDVASSPETFNGFKFNPRAEVLAHLNHYRYLLPAEFLHRATEALVADIDFDSADLGKSDFLCLRVLAETDGLPDGLAERITDWLAGVLPELVQDGSTRWKEYGLTPLEAAPSPGTPWASAIGPAELDANLEELIDYQLEDGSWPLTWSWDFIDAQAWATAAREWKGLWIVNHLSALKAYGRLAEGPE
jgi:hypothetical protein